MVAVKFEMDTKDLANLYDEVSVSQFNDGCVLLEKLALRSGSSVLDIGCGTGMLGREVINIIGETGQYFGIDPSAERIAVACSKNSYQNAVYQCGRAEDLSFIASNSIDIVYLNWVFHWVPDKSMVLEQILRVLKPNGKLGITLPCKELRHIVKLNSIIDQVLEREPYKDFVKIEQSAQKQNNLTTTELIQLLISSGFKFQDVQIQTSSRTFHQTQDITNFLSASYFGNYLVHVPDNLREQAITDIEAEFESYRTVEGLKFDYYPLYAVVQKQ